MPVLPVGAIRRDGTGSRHRRPGGFTGANRTGDHSYSPPDPGRVPPPPCLHRHEHGGTGLYRTVLPPRGRSRAGPHGAGSVEYVMVVSGHLTLVADETPYPLGPGDAARFSSAVEHSCTTGTEGAVTHSVLGYPRA
ncbi:cupin domain-containing protein [Streptomyces sp. NPDC088768]|nr:cupin domain-containing protein [Streptomyces sp. TverLS-915]